MKYVGIDYGVRSAHIAIITDKDLTVHTISTDKLDSRQDELIYIRSKIEQFLSDIDIVVIESPVLAGPRNLQVLISMSQVCGVLLTSCTPHTAVTVAVASWKKEIVGKGNASKEEVANWLEKYYPDFYNKCQRQDHIDATCIALYGKLIS
jgi:hypothetical protein